ncbi:MAG: epoxyqueuosine reductase QueH [Lachnospiraceae bacterium]|nr:epoxyqueuosine reductase QueH [Lachnospiraceae bacterium]
MEKRNYALEMERTIGRLREEGRIPTLFLHSCCTPCSSSVLELLSDFFQITVFYYNPNLYPEEEYRHRAREQQAFLKQFPAKHPISFLEGQFHPEQFYEAVRGMEALPEGGERCGVCYRMRLEETARQAKEGGFAFFTTTLSVSPKKDAVRLNTIGEELAALYGVTYLTSDFKKKNGYLRSCELSKEYGMYRQDYCGCEFSYRERKEKHGNTLGRTV